MIEERKPEETVAEERALQPRPDPSSMPAPLAAMADALRANAEMLRRLDASQRRMAETIERSDKSQQVVASTRALNETFRGLSEIQRGLLDAVARGTRGGGVSPLLFLGVALLSGVLAVLLYDRWAAGRTVPTERYEQSRGEAEALRGRIAALEGRISADADKGKDAERRVAERDEALAKALDRAEGLDGRIASLQQDLREKEARLEQFLSVKAQADLAGALQVQNMGLEREVRDLREKIDRLERERVAALGVFGDKLLDLRGVDPEEILAVARRLGVTEEPPQPAQPGGPVELSRPLRKLLAAQVNRLLPDAEESYDLIEVARIADGVRLQDVTLTRNRNHSLVNSLRCKDLVVHVDVDADTVELRLAEGVITSPSRPGEEIPIGTDGHSIFLTGAGVREWLRREGERVAVDEQGRVVWKSAP